MSELLLTSTKVDVLINGHIPENMLSYVASQGIACDQVVCSGADPKLFERGGPEAIVYKILERGGPKSLKCSFQSFSYKSFANIPPKGGPGPPGFPPLDPPLVLDGHPQLNPDRVG